MHTHTTASDGLHSPTDVVNMAKAAGLAGVAITDHDTIAGVREALEAGKAVGLHVVPGIEVSTDGGKQDIHILGYGIDIEDPLFRSFAADQRKVREHRNQVMLELLAKTGVQLRMDEVLAGLVDPDRLDASVGRPHIAAALVRKGVVATVQEAFDRYLAKGRPAYVRPERIHPTEAVDRIRQAGGAAVIAHPGLYHDDELMRSILDHGVDGIEVYHYDHTSEDEQRYAAWAEQYGIVPTGGSDFHGSREGVLYHGRVGDRYVSMDVLNKLKLGQYARA